MSNREQRILTSSVHVLMGLARPSHGQKSQCMRSVDKGRGDELRVFEAKLRAIGGYWRIHRTVNARDVEKARKWLLCKPINHPEKASYIDSEWRTALLQPENIYGQKKFMLDVDTKDTSILPKIEYLIAKEGVFIERHESPNGWHYITMPFDTREICTLEDVTLVRDGYYFIKEVDEAPKLETERIDWMDKHCSFVCDEEYNIGPYKIGELRKMADDGIRIDKEKGNT